MLLMELEMSMADYILQPDDLAVTGEIQHNQYNFDINKNTPFQIQSCLATVIGDE